MRVGMTLPWNEPDASQLRHDGIARGAERLEEAGYDSVWVFDAIGRGFVVPDPLTALAIAATVTERVEVGTCILQLAIRNPVHVAHQIMTAHLVAGDRLSIGVGAGSTKDDFDAFGMDFLTRFEVFPVHLDRIRAILAGNDPQGVDLSPWDAVRGGPRFLIGSWGSGTWIPRAAKEFDGWIASAAKGGRLQEGVEAYRREGGRRAIVTNIHVDLEADMSTADEFPFSLRCPEPEARQRLEWLQELGFDDVILRTTDHSPANLARIRRLVDQISG